MTSPTLPNRALRRAAKFKHPPKDANAVRRPVGRPRKVVVNLPLGNDNRTANQHLVTGGTNGLEAGEHERESNASQDGHVVSEAANTATGYPTLGTVPVPNRAPDRAPTREASETAKRGGKSLEDRLTEQLADYYGYLALGLRPLNERLAMTVMDRSEVMAASWVAWGKSDPAVMRVLKRLTQVGGASGVVLAHLPLVAVAAQELHLFPSNLFRGKVDSGVSQQVPPTVASRTAPATSTYWTPERIELARQAAITRALAQQATVPPAGAGYNPVDVGARPEQNPALEYIERR